MDGDGKPPLNALTAKARQQPLASLRLRVEPDNYARRRYERAGCGQGDQVGGP